MESYVCESGSKEERVLIGDVDVASSFNAWVIVIALDG